MTKAQWIPCSKQLPDESGYYTVTKSTYNKNDKEARYITTEFWDNDMEFWKDFMPVIAWRPGIIEPYKGDIK